MDECQISCDPELQNVLKYSNISPTYKKPIRSVANNEYRSMLTPIVFKPHFLVNNFPMCYFKHSICHQVVTTLQNNRMAQEVNHQWFN